MNTMKYDIIYDPKPKPEDTQLIWKGISLNAKEMKDLPSGKPFAFFLKDEKGVIKGGCSGFIYYGCFYIDLLWVDKALRGNQYGKKLMLEAENLARADHSKFMAVNTMDFEALDFYKKLGFYVEFERTGFEKDCIFYFLRKDMNG